MKVLNLYAGIGGNRKLWGDGHDITSVELVPEIADHYHTLYPSDTIIVGDAHEYLVKHVMDGWDFIWASPPCPTHSRINRDGNRPPVYPDMKLYQEIIMLSNNWYKGKWCIENVIPYYEALIPPTIEIDRHYFWSNFIINKIEVEPETPISKQRANDSRYGFSFENTEFCGPKVKVLRNLVNPEIGLNIFNTAFSIISSKKYAQCDLFERNF